MRSMRYAAVGLLVVGVAWLSADEADDQFNFATGLLIRNEPRLAADEFQKLLAKSPQFSQADVALYRLGEALQKAGDTAGARQTLERLVRDWPKSGRLTAAHYLLGQLIVAADPRAAAAHFAATMAGEPDGALAEPAAFGQAEAFYQATDWSAAAKAYAAVLTRHPEGKYAPQALYSRGWSEFMAGDFAAATISFDTFGQRFATHELAAECRLKRADSLFKQKRLDEALQAYDKVKTDKAVLNADALVGRAWCLHEQHKLDAAVSAFSAAAQALGKEPRAAVCLFNAGNDAIAVGQFGVAAELFARVRGGEWPDHELVKPSAYWQALAQLRQGKTDQAVALIEDFRKSGPPADLLVDTLMLLAEARTIRREYAVAAGLYAVVLKEHAASPLAGEAAAGRVLALEKSGDVAGAEAAAVAFVTAYPQHAQLAMMRFLIGEYRYRQGKYAEALPAFEAFLKAAPQHEFAADALFKSGWAASNLKDVARARAAFGMLVTNFPASPLAAEAAFMGGRAADTAGDTASAALAFGAAVRLGGGTNVPAQRAALELVRLDQRAKHFDAALRGAETFITAHAAAGPRLAFAWLYKGEALLELGRPAEALQAYAQVGTNDPAAAAAAATGGAWAQRKLGRHAEAAVIFQRLATGVEVEALEAAFWAARSWEDAGKPAEALSLYDDLLKRPVAGQMHADEASYRRAVCFWRVHGAPAAEPVFIELLAARPQSAFVPAALYDLAWVLLEQKKAEVARQRFDDLSMRFPKDELTPDARFRSGEIAYDLQAFTNAAASYEAALIAGVSFTDKVLYKLGWAREKMGQLEPALAVFQRLAREFPQSELADEARYRQGRLLQALGRPAEAIDVFAAVGAGVFASRAAFGRAESLRVAGRHKEALSAYDNVLKQWPQGETRIQAQLGRGHSLRALGANQDAVEAYAAVIKATDTLDAAQAVLGQGYAFFAMNAWEDAAKSFLKVDILYGYDELKPEALNMLVKTWEQAGDTVKAAKYRAEREQRYPGR